MESISPLKALHWLLLLIFWASVQLCWAQSFPMDSAEYQEIKKVSWDIMERASFEKSAFISVGRSGAALVAYFSELRAGSAGMLPFSSAHRFKDSMTQDLVNPSEHVREMNERNQLFLDQHFERFIGPIVAANPGRKIIFMDYVLRGSFNSALFMIREFMSRKYPQTRIDFLALIETNRWERQKQWIPKRKAIFLDNYHIFKSRLLNSHYDPVSPYGEFTFEGNILPQKAVSEGTRYEDFRSALRSFMVQDSKLWPDSGLATKLRLLCPRVVGG